MSENKFIAKLKGEPTPKSVVEIQNDRLVAPFKSSPMGHIADRDSSVVVAKGAQNWAVNQGQLVPVADDYIGTESDLTATSRVSGAGLWLNATYTFPQTGNEKNPVSAIIAPSAKWVLTLCGDSLFTNNGNSITLTMIVKIGASHISTKSFRISEQASQFSKRMAIDFSESEQQVIKALGGSPLTVQVLCDDEGASATIYGGMTHLTLLQRKVDADLVSTDNILLPEFIETLLEGYIIPEDYFNHYEYLDQIQDGGKAMPEFTRNGDKVKFTGWAKPATEVYSKTEIDDKFTVTNAQIDANADAIQKTRDDMNEEDGRLQTQITAHAAAITALQNEQTATGNQIQTIESKIPDGTSDTNPLINKQQLLDEEMDIREDLNSGLSELQTQITAQAGAITTLRNDTDELGDQVSGIESKIPEDTSETNPLVNSGGLTDYAKKADLPIDSKTGETLKTITADTSKVVINGVNYTTYSVYQRLLSDDKEYPLAAKGAPNTTSGVSTINFSSDITMNPSKGSISCKELYVNGQSFAGKVDVAGDTMTGTLNVPELNVQTAEGTLNMSITAGVATIATNNGLDIVSQTKFDTAPTTDDATAWADANPTALVSKRQVADALAGGASGLTSVATDDTITGDGTPDKPLSVADALASKADDSSVVHTTGNENIGGAKNITESLNFFAGENDSFAGFMYKQPSTGNLVLGNRVEGNTDWMSVLTFGVDGSVKIKAANPTNLSTNKNLLMNHDGTITWNGIPVICAKTRVPTGSTYTWYIELSNGLVLQGGRASGTWSISSGQEVVPSVTLPIAVDTGYSFAFFQPKEIYCITIGYYFNSSTNVRPRFGTYTTNRTLSSFDWMVIGKKA